MKKLFLILALIATTIVTNAIEVNDSLIQKQEQIIYNSEMATDIKDFLVLVGGKLENGLQNGYDIFVQQQKVYSIQYLILLILGASLLIYGIYLGNKAIKAEQNTLFGTVSLVMSIAGVFLLIIGFTNLNLIIQGLINPDYAAIKEIIDIVNKSIK
jgi:hypothetical protein